MNLYKKILNRLNDIILQNEENEDISCDSIKKESTIDTNNSIHQLEDITSVTVDDDFQNILEVQNFDNYF